MFNGKIHYKWPCSIAMLNYQRVQFLNAVFGPSRARSSPLGGEHRGSGRARHDRSLSSSSVVQSHGQDMENNGSRDSGYNGMNYVEII
jgi:hypothetical protein